MSLCGCKFHREPWSLRERKFAQKEYSSGPAPGWASAGIFERICLLSKIGYFRGGLGGRISIDYSLAFPGVFFQGSGVHGLVGAMG